LHESNWKDVVHVM